MINNYVTGEELEDNQYKFVDSFGYKDRIYVNKEIKHSLLVTPIDKGRSRFEVLYNFTDKKKLNNKKLYHGLQLDLFGGRR